MCRSVRADRGPGRRSGAWFCTGFTSAYRRVGPAAGHGRSFGRLVAPQPMTLRRRTRLAARHRRHGVTATPIGVVPTGMLVGYFVLAFTSMLDNAAGSLVTKAVLPSGVTATQPRFEP